MSRRLLPPRRELEAAIGKHALLIAARLMHRMPLGAALGCGRGLGRLAPRLTPRRFQRVCQDIALAFGDTLPPEEVTRIAGLCYQRLGESLVEFLRLPYLSSEEIGRWATLEGTGHLEAALARGQGVILLTGHLGNWEMCGTVMGLSPYPTTAIARPQADDTLTDLFTRIREAHGLRVVPMTDVRGCIRVLKRNECLGIVGDVNASIPGAFVQFFGRPAATYTGAAYLAQTTGAEVLTIFDERLPDARHRITIGPPIPLLRTGDARRNLLLNTMRTQYVLQEEVRRRPQDWFWQLQRWKTRPEGVPAPERIPMEHRDLDPEEVRATLAPVLAR